jgi:hypothetical protein
MPTLSRPTKIILIISGAALLFMMLFYPFGYDQAAFSVGADAVLKKGAIPYRDFLDTKPPFIFYIYSIALFIFGHHDWSIRAFDILFQFATLFYFYKLLKKYAESETLALLSVFTYIVLYTGSGYWMTAQAETFALLPSLLIFDRTERFIRDRKQFLLHGILIGLAATVLFYLKITLLTVPLGALLYVISQKNKEKSFPLLGVGFLAFTIGVGAYAAYLSGAGALTRWMESLQWVSDYAAINPLFSSETLRKVYFELFPAQLIASFSVTFAAFIGIGLFLSFRDRKNGGEGSYLFHLALQFFLGLAAVLYERKCFPYHYSRAFWAASPFIFLGATHAFRRWKEYYPKTGPTLKKSIFCLALAIAIFYSPFIHLITQPLRWTYMSIAGLDKEKAAQEMHGSYPLKDEIDLANRYKTRLAATDEVFFWGNHVGVLFYLDKLPPTLALTNTPLVTAWTPQDWRDTMMRQLERANPPMCIVERNDIKSFISGNPTDSYHELLSLSPLHSYFDRNYLLTDSVGVFLVFERKSSIH